MSERQGAATRARILEAALDLFSEQGYDKTSLREIAERVDVTKAALYYYFPSKQDILGALAQQFFDVTGDALTMDPAAFDLEEWRRVLADLVDRMLAQRRVVALLERNRTVLEHLQDDADRFASHQRLHDFVDQVVGNPDLPLVGRVRFACSFGAAIGVVLGMGEGFPGVSADELRPLVLSAIDDVLGLAPREARAQAAERSEPVSSPASPPTPENEGNRTSAGSNAPIVPAPGVATGVGSGAA